MSNLQIVSDSEHKVSFKFSHKFSATGQSDFANLLSVTTESVKEQGVSGDGKLLKCMYQRKEAEGLE